MMFLFLRVRESEIGGDASARFAPYLSRATAMRQNTVIKLALRP
ncbi:MAG: hypothetical protein ACKVQT_25170 [Burkholderiales bacterium]